jgi:hypothetical protein
MSPCKYTGQFGPLVIGQEEFDAEQKLEKGGAKDFGPAVTGKHPAPEAFPPPLDEESELLNAFEEDAPPEAEVASLSVRAIKEELKGTNAPSVIDRIMRDEFSRADGIRKSVMQLLLKKEAGRDSPRPEVLEVLESQLAE